MIYILLLASTFALVSPQSCIPFGKRIQYGQQLLEPTSTHKVSISFNTNFTCPDSFIRVLTAEGFLTVSCSSQQIVTSADMSFFTTHIQRCDLHDEISYDKTLLYNVFGWDRVAQSDPTPGSADWIEVNLIDPQNHDREINVMVLADWGPSYQTGFKPIHNTYRQLKNQKDFNLLVIGGDISYDLDSRNGVNYIEFLVFAEEILSQVPSVFVPGNHDNYSEDDKVLLNSTFLAYNITLNLAFGFAFGDCYFIMYDPYSVLYSSEGEVSSLVEVAKELTKAKKTGLFIIPVSHYPIACNDEHGRCDIQGIILAGYFARMIDAGVCLHLGAHAHQYNRIYPYFKDRVFKRIESPYRDDQEYIVSVVEGVAGNNKDMTLEMKEIQDYTAGWTANETGFGVLTTNSNREIVYGHYSTDRGLVDEMVIKKMRDRSGKRHRGNRVWQGLRRETQVASE